jgi:cytosine/uracil/thiamine/allantoin permease
MLRYNNRITSYGSETRTNIPKGLLWGAAIGFFIGSVFSVAIEIDQLKLVTSIFVDSNHSKWTLLIFPIMGLFFGAVAGTLVGIGVPRFKARPEQGRGEVKKHSVI